MTTPSSMIDRIVGGPTTAGTVVDAADVVVVAAEVEVTAFVVVGASVPTGAAVVAGVDVAAEVGVEAVLVGEEVEPASSSEPPHAVIPRVVITSRGTSRRWNVTATPPAIRCRPVRDAPHVDRRRRAERGQCPNPSG
jgi:hypothetical protein